MPFERLADNLARFRKVRDLSQEQLTLAAGVGVDTVARIEQGRRTTCRPETLRNLALALEVHEEALLGHEPSERTAALDISPLRVSITAGDLLPGFGDFAEAAETIGLDAMAATCHIAWRAYVDGRHAPLLDMLPGVLVDARRIVQSTSDIEKARANRLLSTAYRLAAGIAGRLGHPDLAWSAGERALRAAAESDDPRLGVAISLRYLAWVLVRQGRFEEAERLAVAAAERIQPAMLDRDPKRAGVYGNLLFNAASAALFAGRAQYAEDLLHEAQAAAARAGAGYADEAAIFGPRVAAIQRIEHAAHAHDPEQVLRLAQTLPADASKAQAFWEAGHRLRLAAAATECCRYRDALTYLAQARDLAPDWARHQPLGAKTMRQLVDRATRRRGPDFSQLALHYNVADYQLSMCRPVTRHRV